MIMGVLPSRWRDARHRMARRLDDQKAPSEGGARPRDAVHSQTTRVRFASRPGEAAMF